MAGIVFFYEPYEVDVWSGKGFDAWNYAVKAAGDITSAAIVNKTEDHITPFDVSMDIQIETSFDDLILPGTVTYMVPPWDLDFGTEELWVFDHNTDWYVFGPASAAFDIPYGAQTITIPQSGNGALHSVHICSVVMMHRYGVLHP